MASAFPLQATSWPLGLDHSITVRPIRPDDADLERAFAYRLSRESVYNRFFGARRTLTPEWLAQLTCIDYSREMALIATVVLEASETQIGVARYVRAGSACECAIVVADAWQGRGVGTRLMRELIGAAARSGITVIQGDVLATNRPMLALARKLGMSVRTSPEGATLRRVVLSDLSGGAPLPQQPFEEKRA